MVRKKYTEEEFKLGQLAAFVDGEGTIGIAKIQINKKSRNISESYSLVLRIGNTNKKLIDWLKKEFSGHINDHPTKNRHWKDSYDWVIKGYGAYKLLIKIEPYLLLKNTQAKIGIRFFYETQRTGNKAGAKPIWKVRRQENYYQQIKELNKRGIDIEATD